MTFRASGGPSFAAAAGVQVKSLAGLGRGVAAFASIAYNAINVAANRVLQSPAGPRVLGSRRIGEGPQLFGTSHRLMGPLAQILDARSREA